MKKILKYGVYLLVMFIVFSVAYSLSAATPIHSFSNKDFISDGATVSFSFKRQSDLLNKMSFVQKIETQSGSRIRQHPYLNHNSKQIDHTVTAVKKVILNIHSDEFVSDNLGLLLRLPKVEKQNWTFATTYSYSGDTNDLEIGLYRRVNGRDYLLYREDAEASGYITVNLGVDEHDNAYRDLFIEVIKKDPTASGELKLFSPVANSKENIFYDRSIINFINFTTILALTPEQDSQLVELYEAGHRTWVLGGIRGNVEFNSQVVFEKIKQHPILSKVKIILGVQNLISNDFCEYVERVEGIYGVNHRGDTVVNRNGTAFDQDAINIYPIGSNASTNTGTDDTSIFLENCAKIKSSANRSEVDTVLVEHLDQYKRVANSNKDLVVGIFAFDEPAHKGVPLAYQRDIYKYFNATLPNKTITNVRSFYIGHKTIANKYNQKDYEGKSITKEFFNPNTSDVVLYDHYSNIAIGRGNSVRIEEMYDFLFQNQMLSKPYVKLYSGGIREPNWSCSYTNENGVSQYRPVSDYKNVYDITEQVLRDFGRGNSITGSDKAKPTFENNGNNNMGYWAFYSKEAFPTTVVGWESTLAHQEEGFCSNQYEAVLQKSREYYR